MGVFGSFTGPGLAKDETQKTENQKDAKVKLVAKDEDGKNKLGYPEQKKIGPQQPHASLLSAQAGIFIFLPISPLKASMAGLLAIPAQRDLEPCRCIQ